MAFASVCAEGKCLCGNKVDLHDNLQKRAKLAVKSVRPK